MSDWTGKATGFGFVSRAPTPWEIYTLHCFLLGKKPRPKWLWTLLRPFARARFE